MQKYLCYYNGLISVNYNAKSISCENLIYYLFIEIFILFVNNKESLIVLEIVNKSSEFIREFTGCIILYNFLKSTSLKFAYSLWCKWSNLGLRFVEQSKKIAFDELIIFFSFYCKRMILCDCIKSVLFFFIILLQI